MEAQEDANSSSSTGESLCQAIIKRKRTKRHRTLPMPPPSAAASSASSGTTTNEEEDMANCLILLAQGRTLQVNVGATATTERAAGARLDRLYHLYVCKTCGKSFPSFQALGGHRASHKKPKMAAKDESELTSSTSKQMPFLSIGGGKPRTHECSICRAEFSSGQALGGHMRRHRPTVFPEIGSECKRQKSGFSLDLNLPAPGEDEPFGGGGGPDNSLVFSQSPAVAIVDCYY